MEGNTKTNICNTESKMHSPFHRKLMHWEDATQFVLGSKSQCGDICLPVKVFLFFVSFII